MVKAVTHFSARQRLVRDLKCIDDLLQFTPQAVQSSQSLHRWTHLVQSLLCSLLFDAEYFDGYRIMVKGILVGLERTLADYSVQGIKLVKLTLPELPLEMPVLRMRPALLRVDGDVTPAVAATVGPPSSQKDAAATPTQHAGTSASVSAPSGLPTPPRVNATAPPPPVLIAPVSSTLSYSNSPPVTSPSAPSSAPVAPMAPTGSGHSAPSVKHSQTAAVAEGASAAASATPVLPSALAPPPRPALEGYDFDFVWDARSLSMELEIRGKKLVNYQVMMRVQHFVVKGIVRFKAEPRHRDLAQIMAVSMLQPPDLHFEVSSAAQAGGMNLPFQKKIESYISEELKKATLAFLQGFIVFPNWYSLVYTDETSNPHAELFRLAYRWHSVSQYPFPFPTAPSATGAARLDTELEQVASETQKQEKKKKKDAVPKLPPLDTDMVAEALGTLNSMQRCLIGKLAQVQEERRRLENLLSTYIAAQPNNAQLLAVQSKLVLVAPPETPPALSSVAVVVTAGSKGVPAVSEASVVASLTPHIRTQSQPPAPALTAAAPASAVSSTAASSVPDGSVSRVVVPAQTPPHANAIIPIDGAVKPPVSSATIVSVSASVPPTLVSVASPANLPSLHPSSAHAPTLQQAPRQAGPPANKPAAAAVLAVNAVPAVVIASRPAASAAAWSSNSTPNVSMAYSKDRKHSSAAPATPPHPAVSAVAAATTTTAATGSPVTSAISPIVSNGKSLTSAVRAAPSHSALPNGVPSAPLLPAPPLAAVEPQIKLDVHRQVPHVYSSLSPHPFPGAPQKATSSSSLTAERTRALSHAPKVCVEDLEDGAVCNDGIVLSHAHIDTSTTTTTSSSSGTPQKQPLAPSQPQRQAPVLSAPPAAAPTTTQSQQIRPPVESAAFRPPPPPGPPPSKKR